MQKIVKYTLIHQHQYNNVSYLLSLQYIFKIFYFLTILFFLLLLWSAYQSKHVEVRKRLSEMDFLPRLWVRVIELTLSGVYDKQFYPVTHSAEPKYFYLFMSLLVPTSLQSLTIC